MKKQTKFHKVLLFVLLALFTIPFLESHFKVIKPMPLKGVLDTLNNTPFSWKEWLSGKYQEDKDKVVNDSFGFRDILVRLNNQVDYSVFGKINANNIIEGKGGYLFGLNQIKAYTGEDFIGEDSIRRKLEKIKFLQDTLRKLNKTLLIIFAPGK